MITSTLGFTGLGFLGLSYALVVVFIAAVIRGYTGFGFSALVVAGLSLVLLPPAEVVPTVLMLEIAASIHMLPLVWKHIDWRTLGWLSLGCAVSIPAGVYLLANVPEVYMRIVISLSVLIVSILMWRGYRLRSRGSTGLTLVTGLISGAMNGAAGIGGLAVVLLFLSTSAEVAVTRATLVVYLLAIGIYTSAVAGAHGLFNMDVLTRTGLFLVPLFLGIAVGSRHFLKAKPQSFRRFVLILLMALSITGLVRAYFS